MNASVLYQSYINNFKVASDESRVLISIWSDVVKNKICLATPSDYFIY
jgi:hypothetical protein